MRPRVFTYLAFACLAVAAGFPLQIMLTDGHAPWEIIPILFKIAPINWVVIGLSLCTFIFIWRASRMIQLMIPLLIVSVGYNNWLVASYALNADLNFAMASVFLFTISLAPVLSAPVRYLMRHPGARWWLTPERKKIKLPVRISLSANEYFGSTFNLSESGVFVSYENGIPGFDPEKTAVGSLCSVSLPVLNGLKFIECRAEIVRSTGGGYGYPPGLGIRFKDLGFFDRRILHTFLQALPA